jgi:prepilin-type N-terminal cleavage/methylation domain-containing protein
MRRHTRDNGFTLIEVMITVAIIGILASIAIPMFTIYQVRSRRTEAMTNLSAIGRALDSYYAEYSAYIGTTTTFPGGHAGFTKVRWTAAAEAEFGPTGWRPEGEVMYDYAVNDGTFGGCTCATGTCFTASAWGDMDADGSLAVVLLARPDAAGNDCRDLLFGIPSVAGGVVVHDRPLTYPELVFGGAGKY